MSAWRTVRAPAKINLFLHITGRRADGYHTLQTIFQLLDWCDVLHFRAQENGELTHLNPLPGVPAEQDLIIRAAARLREAAGINAGMAVKIDKHLPMGAGIGGGSSDAASTLLALNQLWELDWPLAKLAELGAALGADVPVFVHGNTAWAEGIGEQLSPVTIPPAWYLLIYPGVPVTTGVVFSAPDLPRNTPPVNLAQYQAGHCGNDCEAVVRKNYPAVNDAMNWLAQHADVHLTGTGSCIFAAFPTETEARQVLDVLPAQWRGWVAKGVGSI